MAHANAVNSPLRKRERQRQPAPPGLPLSHTRDLPRPREPQKRAHHWLTLTLLPPSTATTAATTLSLQGLAWALSTCTSTPLVSPAVGFLFPPGRTPSPFSGSRGETKRPQQTRPDRDHLLPGTVPSDWPCSSPSRAASTTLATCIFSLLPHPPAQSLSLSNPIPLSAPTRSFWALIHCAVLPQRAIVLRLDSSLGPGLLCVWFGLVRAAPSGPPSPPASSSPSRRPANQRPPSLNRGTLRLSCFASSRPRSSHPHSLVTFASTALAAIVAFSVSLRLPRPRPRPPRASLAIAHLHSSHRPSSSSRHAHVHEQWKPRRRRSSSSPSASCPRSLTTSPTPPTGDTTSPPTNPDRRTLRNGKTPVCSIRHSCRKPTAVSSSQDHTTTCVSSPRSRPLAT